MIDDFRAIGRILNCRHHFNNLPLEIRGSIVDHLVDPKDTVGALKTLGRFSSINRKAQEAADFILMTAFISRTLTPPSWATLMISIISPPSRTAGRLSLQERHTRRQRPSCCRKMDRKDAPDIAQLLRMGWYRTVHSKSSGCQNVRAL